MNEIRALNEQNGYLRAINDLLSGAKECASVNKGRASMMLAAARYLNDSLGDNGV